jgi:type III secretion protein R
MLRNAIGVQQVPGNMVVYGIATVVTVLVMSPAIQATHLVMTRDGGWPTTSIQIVDRLPQAVQPLKEFMQRNINPEYHQSMFVTAEKFQRKYGGTAVARDDLLVVLPAFVMSEISSAFRIGLALYLPFVVIDLVVSSVLMGLGMMMVSPQTITTPLKVVAFVAVDGWARLMEGLMLAYL